MKKAYLLKIKYNLLNDLLNDVSYMSELFAFRHEWLKTYQMVETKSKGRSSS